QKKTKLRLKLKGLKKKDLALFTYPQLLKEKLGTAWLWEFSKPAKKLWNIALNSKKKRISVLHQSFRKSKSKKLTQTSHCEETRARRGRRSSSDAGVRGVYVEE